MTELPEDRITVGKLQANELQIQLGEPPAASTPVQTETKVVKPERNKPQ